MKSRFTRKKQAISQEKNSAIHESLLRQKSGINLQIFKANTNQYLNGSKMGKSWRTADWLALQCNYSYQGPLTKFPTNLTNKNCGGEQ